MIPHDYGYMIINFYIYASLINNYKLLLSLNIITMIVIYNYDSCSTHVIVK